MRLSPETLVNLPPEVARFAYDRAAQQIGIVHFGIGAFHRAHQAWYTDRAMDAGDRDWAICGASLRSPGVKTQLGPQGGLYSLTMHDGEGSETHVIGAVREVLFAGEDAASIAERIASPTCHIVSFTVTEKGYCRNADGSLDFALAETGFYPLLAEGLARRRAAGLGGLTLMSCDNLSHNGEALSRLMREYLEAKAPDLAHWFAAECTCPNSMVDRIVPAAIESDLAGAEAALGMRDEAAIVTESFSQWVIEDNFCSERPAWEDVGALLVKDVAHYETMKLRLLNGSHSLLAYSGYLAGYLLAWSVAGTDPAPHRPGLAVRLTVLVNNELTFQTIPPGVVHETPHGMHGDVVDMLLNIAPKKIVYVSCNPSTQARDIQLLSAKYNLVKLYL